MTICSPEAGNIARGRSPRAILPVEGEQIVMSPSLKGNNCFIIPNHFRTKLANNNITLHKGIFYSILAKFGRQKIFYLMNKFILNNESETL